jgi:hypothetical protein
VFYIGQILNLWNKNNTDKERKEKEQIEKKNSPLIQVDKQSDPISNFIMLI